MSYTTKLLSLACVFSLLVACGAGESDNQYHPEETTALFLNGGCFSETLELLDTDIAYSLYGLEETDVLSAAAYLSTGATAEECTVLVLADADATDKAEAALQARIDGQTEVLADYQPAELSKLENAILKRSGNSVLMVVPANSETTQQILAGLNG